MIRVLSNCGVKTQLQWLLMTYSWSFVVLYKLLHKGYRSEMQFSHQIELDLAYALLEVPKVRAFSLYRAGGFKQSLRSNFFLILFRVFARLQFLCSTDFLLDSWFLSYSSLKQRECSCYQTSLEINMWVCWVVDDTGDNWTRVNAF